MNHGRRHAGGAAARAVLIGLLLGATGLAAGEFDGFAHRVADTLAPQVEGDTAPIDVVIPPPKPLSGSPANARIARVVDAVQTALERGFAEPMHAGRLHIIARPAQDPYGDVALIFSQGTDLSGLAMRGGTTRGNTREAIITITYQTAATGTTINADLKLPDGTRRQLATETVPQPGDPAPVPPTVADTPAVAATEATAPTDALFAGLPPRTLAVGMMLARYSGAAADDGLVSPLLRTTLAAGEAIEFHVQAETDADAIVLGLYADGTWKFILPARNGDTRIGPRSRRIAASRIAPPFGPEHRLVIACTDPAALAELACELFRIPGNTNDDDHLATLAAWVGGCLGGRRPALSARRAPDGQAAASFSTMLSRSVRAADRRSAAAPRWGWLAVPLVTVP